MPKHSGSKTKHSGGKTKRTSGQPVTTAGRAATGRTFLDAALGGSRVAKKHKDTPRRIDAAVAAVMAHDRAAALAGSVRDSIYI
jgi:hypothetical protein